MSTVRDRVEEWIFRHEVAQKEGIRNLTIRDARGLLDDLRSHERDLRSDLNLIDKTRKAVKDALLSEVAA